MLLRRQNAEQHGPAVIDMADDASIAELWSTTLDLLEQGKAEDDAGNGPAACLLYSEALDGLASLLRSETDARRRSLLAERQTEYLARLAELHSITAARSTPPPTATPPAEPALAEARLRIELAVQTDEAGDGARALELYTSASERLYAALKLVTDPAAAAKHRATLSSLLDRAEQLKAGPSNPIPPSATPVAGAPVAVSVTAGAASRAQPRAAELLTLEEKAALARSSVIDGRKYYPWVDDQVREKFDTPSGQPWSDPDGLLALSSEQKVKHTIGFRLPTSLPPPSHILHWIAPRRCVRFALCLPSGQDIYMRRVYIYIRVYITPYICIYRITSARGPDRKSG